MSVVEARTATTGAPERDDGLPTVVPLPAPKIHVRRTKTAGWQVAYVAKSGRVTVRRRNADFRDAMVTGAAASRVYGVPLEVDQ